MYKRESGFDVINMADVPVEFEIEERSIVRIPPGQSGGNHKHPRVEAFVAVEGKGMKLVWLDEKNEKHTDLMMGEELKLFVIPSYLPHAVVNESDNEMGILIEFSDGLQRDVEKVDVLQWQS